MSRTMKFLAIPALAIALLAVSAPSKAEAGGFAFGFGGVRVGVGHPVGFRAIPRPRIIRHRPIVHIGHPPYYHNTTRLDYHPPRIVPHNGHLGYIPGYYSVQRTGPWQY